MLTSDQLSEARRSGNPKGPMMVGKPGMRRPCAAKSVCIRLSLAVKSTDGRSDCSWLSRCPRWISLHQAFFGSEIHRRQKRLQLAEPLPARGVDLGSAEDDAQVVLDSPLDGFVQGQIDGLRRDFAHGYAALEGRRGLRGCLA